jgi:glycosyltransferase involved in cell wall biosynthesis
MSEPPPADPLQRTVWLVSAYHTGSHRSWAEGYARHSRLRVRLLTMEGRFWKWRMQGGAIELAAQAERLLAQGGAPDAIVSTDMVNVPAWLALVRRSLPARTPLVHYMHENQLTYPWPPQERPDLGYPMLNWLSQLCADVVAFNSEFHRASWFAALPNLLKHFPDYNHLGLVKEVARRARVLPVGIETEGLAAGDAARGAPPLILWNQRWEYDKRPDRFFALLYRLQAAGVPFRLAVAGENFRRQPAEFEEARARLAEVTVHWGYAPTRAAYAELLRAADLVISTADHEFFGVSILEAIAAGAFPLLPRRLSYPELIPASLHAACLYDDEEELFAKAVLRLAEPRAAPPSLRAHVAATFGWPRVARLYDDLVEELAARGPGEGVGEDAAGRAPA